MLLFENQKSQGSFRLVSVLPEAAKSGALSKQTRHWRRASWGRPEASRLGKSRRGWLSQVDGNLGNTIICIRQDPLLGLIRHDLEQRPFVRASLYWTAAALTPLLLQLV
jgi:hypothetical protein